MGDPGPFQGDLVIDDHVGTEIVLVQRPVLPAEEVGGEGLALGGQLTDAQLEFGEHGLAVQGPLELLQEVVEQPGAPPPVLGGLEQVLHQKGLVAGGGHLSHKDHIVPVHRGLRPVGQIGVDRVAQFMGQGEHTVQIVLIVEQDIGVDQRPGHIAAGPLSHALIDVDPAAVQPLPEDGLIVGPQRSHGLIDRLPGVGVGDPGVHPGDHGGVHVIEVQLLQAQQPFPQTDIAVHLVQVGPDGRDEIVIDLHRDVGTVQRGGQGAGIVPGGGEKLKLLDLGVQGGGQGVFDPAVDGVQVLEGGAAQGAVLAGHEQGEGAVGQGVAAALSVHSVWEGEVGVGQLGEDVIRGLGQFSGGGQQALLAVGQGVGPAALDVVEIPAEQLQPGLQPVKFLQRLAGEAQKLGDLEGGGTGQLHILSGDPAHHGLVLRDAGVLVAPALGVVHQPDQKLAGLLLQGQKVIEDGGAPTQAALILCQLVSEALEAGQVLLPRLVRGIQVGGVPGIGLRDGGTLRNGFLLGHDERPPMDAR